MIEARVLEGTLPNVPSAGKKVVRMGLTLAGTPHLSDKDSCYFDNEGWFVSGKKRVRTNQKFNKDSHIALLVNLDAMSANADTVTT